MLTKKTVTVERPQCEDHALIASSKDLCLKTLSAFKRSLWSILKCRLLQKARDAKERACGEDHKQLRQEQRACTGVHSCEGGYEKNLGT
jgi:hypothetical protein